MFLLMYHWCSLVDSADVLGVICQNLISLLANPDVKEAVKHRAPLVRSSTLNWVTFCIETSNKTTVLKLHKEYVPICMEVNLLIQKLIFL